MEQGTPEWFEARLGKVTASRIVDVVARTKTGYSASRENYMAQLVVERITGKIEQSYTNAAMAWGTEHEPMARAEYEIQRGVMVNEIGFVPHPTIANAGASPDGLIGDKGLIEIKCPNTATHIDTLLTRQIPLKYLYQMFWQMTCTGREWCDFASYDPRMPDHLKLCVIHVPFNADRISELEDEVTKFLHEVDAKVDKLMNLLRETNE
ncbi:phage_rel_nuc, putative phage-type endonuclease [uncultured Caudovirales phage]|uniref:Phage_rel_nuc, putative phage-type endonuclease n=1 Tax=uncultured Caudovirales phage TaxID=2100421 RepID=A0A6J5LHB4_9CAUD|nr:phage_rel_nuc, putative phage-type endonuclease [uncultured Caudovirales phage]